jgi:hypothetical protein
MAPWMVLPLRTAMPVGPPEMRLLLRKPPVRNVLLMTVTPPAPIVSALVTPPLKVVALITMALVWQLNLVGYGPVNATKFPNALSDQQSARTIPPLYAVAVLPILAVIVSIRWLGMRALLASAAGLGGKPRG